MHNILKLKSDNVMLLIDGDTTTPTVESVGSSSTYGAVINAVQGNYTIYIGGAQLSYGHNLSQSVVMVKELNYLHTRAESAEARNLKLAELNKKLCYRNACLIALIVGFLLTEFVLRSL